MEGERLESAPEPVRDMSTGELIGYITERTRTLVRDEVALAKVEARLDLRRELRAGIGLASAGVLGICGLSLLLVAGTFALAAYMPAWGAALIVAGVVLIVGTVLAMIGKKRLVRAPLYRTRESLKENVEWASGKTHH